MGGEGLGGVGRGRGRGRGRWGGDKHRGENSLQGATGVKKKCNFALRI